MGLMLTIAVAQYSQYFLYSACEYLGYRDKLMEVRKGGFFCTENRGSVWCEISPKSTWLLQELKKISPFAKLEKISHLFWCLLNLENKCSRVWSFLVNCLERLQDEIYLQLPKGNVSENMMVSHQPWNFYWRYGCTKFSNYIFISRNMC